MEFPTLKSDRLVLKKLTQDRLKEVYSHFRDEQVNQYVDFEPVQTLEDAREIIALSRKFSKESKLVLKIIGSKKGSITIGTVKVMIDINIIKEKYAGNAMYNPPLLI